MQGQMPRVFKRLIFSENIDLRETKIKTLNIDVCVMQNVFFKVKKKGNNKHLILIRLLRPTFTFLDFYLMTWSNVSDIISVTFSTSLACIPCNPTENAESFVSFWHLKNIILYLY